MSEHKYMHVDEKYEEELGRLRGQASLIDPVTIRHLETIGVSEGWKCLEVGGGAGSIAEWLSAKVGPSGRVVATDIDLRFLGRLSAPNLEIRKHNILTDNLEEGQYDLIHCRLVLMHLAEPVRAVKRMAQALRPGGWLLIEDHDAGSMLSADVTDSSAALLTAMCRINADFYRRKGIADSYFGRRVRGLVEGLGFTDVGQDGFTRINRGTDSMASNLAATWKAGEKNLITAGLITQEQSDSVYSKFLDPAFYFPGVTLFSAWGRKPVSQQ
jgi:SAM-dependent methyltransferase